MISAIICLLALPLIFLSDSIFEIYLFTAIFTTFACIVGAVTDRSVLLIYAFQLGLIAFVFPDGFVYTNDFTPSTLEIRAATYINLAIVFFSSSYWVFYSRPKQIKQQYINSVKFNSLFILIFIELLYLVFMFKFTVQSISFGRASAVEDGGLNVAGRGILNVIAMILPGLISFAISHKNYSRIKQLSYSIILTIPIFIFIFLQGNRFPLLFSLSIFLFINFPKFLIKPEKSFFSSFIVIVIGLLISSQMVNLRNSVYGVNGEPKLFGFIKSEGILESNVMLMRYFDFNDNTYGTSLLNILFFWIPRSIWSEKPTYLGFWLIREFEDVGSQHSAGFGFSGEAYADFGLFGGLLACSALGLIFSRLERFNYIHRKTYNIKFFYCALLMPFSFFMARNLDTAIFMLISISLLIYLFDKLFTRRISISG